MIEAYLAAVRRGELFKLIELFDVIAKQYWPADALSLSTKKATIGTTPSKRIYLGTDEHLDVLIYELLHSSLSVEDIPYLQALSLLMQDDTLNLKQNRGLEFKFVVVIMSAVVSALSLKKQNISITADPKAMSGLRLIEKRKAITKAMVANDVEVTAAYSKHSKQFKEAITRDNSSSLGKLYARNQKIKLLQFRSLARCIDEYNQYFLAILERGEVPVSLERYRASLDLFKYLHRTNELSGFREGFVSLRIALLLNHELPEEEGNILQSLIKLNAIKDCFAAYQAFFEDLDESEFDAHLRERYMVVLAINEFLGRCVVFDDFVHDQLMRYVLSLRKGLLLPKEYAYLNQIDKGNFLGQHFSEFLALVKRVPESLSVVAWPFKQVLGLFSRETVTEHAEESTQTPVAKS